MALLLRPNCGDPSLAGRAAALLERTDLVVLDDLSESHSSFEAAAILRSSSVGEEHRSPRTINALSTRGQLRDRS